MIGLEADGVFLGVLPPFAVGVAGIAQHSVHAGGVEFPECRAAQHAAPLGQDHAAARREEDVGDGHAAGHPADLDLRVPGEAAVVVEADGPDLRALADRVVQPVAEEAESPHPAPDVRQSPCVGIVRAEVRTGDVRLRAVVLHRIQPLGGAAGRSVVERSQHVAVHVEPEDQAAVQIGDEQLVVGGIEDDVAQPRASVVGPIGLEHREDADLPGPAVDLPDRACVAARSELAFHEGGVGSAVDDRNGIAVRSGRDDVQSVGRGRREIDVGWNGVVHGHAEDLPDVAGHDLELDRGVHQLGLRRSLSRQVEDSHRRTVRVDDLSAAAVDGSGKTGDDGVARVHDPGGGIHNVLGRGAWRGHGHHRQQDECRWKDVRKCRLEGSSAPDRQ